MSQRVVLRVYDLSQGMARAMSQQLIGTQLDIIPHTGVFVYGKEWFFSGRMGGIQSAPTWGVMPIHEEVDLGTTEVPEVLFQEFLESVAEQYSALTYHLAKNNCNHFSNAVAEFLTGTSIPERILKLPEMLLATPMGQAFGPMLEQLGGAMDPLGQAGGTAPPFGGDPLGAAVAQRATPAAPTAPPPAIAAVRCSAGCGFFGSAATDGMCSKCYKQRSVSAQA